MSFDKALKVFAQDGHIYQIEYAFKAIQSFGMTSIAVRGTDSVVVCTQKKVPDRLLVADSVTSIFNIADTIGLIAVGNMNDAKSLVTWLRHQATEFKFKNGYEVPLHVLAQTMGQFQQKYSQYVGMRPFCTTLTLVGCDEEFGPQVFRVDPAGHAVGFRAVSTGTKEQEAMSQLEKHFKKNQGQWSYKEAVEVAIQTLQTVISSDFKANEIEVGVATVQNPRFVKLTEAEIEKHLNELADKA